MVTNMKTNMKGFQRWMKEHPRKRVSGYLIYGDRPLSHDEVKRVVNYAVEKGYRTEADIPDDELQKLLEDEKMNDEEKELLKAHDSFSSKQLDFIRDLFGEQLAKNAKSVFAAEELEIINICQRNLGDPEFESVEQFVNSKSGLWTKIEEGEKV